jgi:hypothetical protein
LSRRNVIVGGVSPSRILLVAFAAAAFAQTQKERPIAPGWTAPESSDYEAGIDHKVVRTGKGSLYLKSTGGNPKDYAARQSIKADAYRGKRIRLTAYVKPDQAAGGGAPWLRVDFQNADYVLDGMLELTARSANVNGWVKCELVAQIPEDALGISFGLRMIGKGEIWADDLSFDVVPATVRTNTIERRKYRASDRDAAIQRLKEQYAKAPDRPVNLGFEN